MDNDAKAKRYDAAVTGIKNLILDADVLIRRLNEQNQVNDARINQTRETKARLETFLGNLTREPQVTGKDDGTT